MGVTWQALHVRDISLLLHAEVVVLLLVVAKAELETLVVLVTQSRPVVSGHVATPDRLL